MLMLRTDTFSMNFHIFGGGGAGVVLIFQRNGKHFFFYLAVSCNWMKKVINLKMSPTITGSEEYHAG